MSIASLDLKHPCELVSCNEVEYVDLMLAWMILFCAECSISLISLQYSLAPLTIFISYLGGALFMNIIIQHSLF